jgi:murein DD-endopeptidase MepM/ murein hydrolase activator NlpD
VYFAVPLVVFALVVAFVAANSARADENSDASENGANADEGEADVITAAALHTAEDVAVAPPFLASPVPAGTRVSQGFTNSHSAIDFAVPVGTDLKACADAVVEQVNSTNPGAEAGLFVIVRGRGVWEQIAWSYSHLTRIDVAVGDELSADDVIGASGDTGDSTGPHLHFAVLTSRFNFVDPRPFLAPVAPEVIA